MSRQALADAVSSVPGYKGHPWQPPAPSPGAGWVLWESTEYEQAMCGAVPTHTWQVVVMLPRLDPSAVDGARDTLAEAIGSLPRASLINCEPTGVQLQESGSDQAPALVYTVRTTT